MSNSDKRAHDTNKKIVYNLYSTFPNRSGAIASRLKAVDSQQMIAIASSSKLIQHVGMCNDKSAAYFGLLLSKEDCLAVIKVDFLSLPFF